MAQAPPLEVKKKSKPRRKPKKIKDLQKIQFLNLPEKHSMATIGLKVYGEISSTSNKYGDNYEIRITDCNNHITLHGNLKSPDSRKNALRKFNTLISALTEGRNHIEQQLKENKLKF